MKSWKETLYQNREMDRIGLCGKWEYMGHFAPMITACKKEEKPLGMTEIFGLLGGLALFLHGMQTIENCCLNAVANLSLDGRKRFVGCRYRHNGRVNFPAQRIKPTVD